MTSAREAIRVREWLESRSPTPPPALALHLASIVGDEICDAPDLALRLVSHAKEILSNIRDDRSYANDLLAADALITYAMEATVELNSDPDLVASQAMRDLSQR